MITAQRALRTAKTLRERGLAATPGPWTSSPKANDALINPAVDRGGRDDRRHYGGCLVGESMASHDQQWLKIVTPDLAVALAELLEWHAGEVPGRLPIALEALIVCIEAGAKR